MGIVKAFKDAVASTFANQWKEIITVGEFDEYTVVAPGILKTSNRERGTNTPGSDGVISNGSKIFVPENTAAFIFNQSAIENIILEPGGYEYQDGDKSVFNHDGIISPITDQVKKRLAFGGISPNMKKIAFVNLREIRNIKFGTPGAQIYHDPFYGTDLELHAHGSFSIRVTDVEKFVRNYVPANTISYSFNDPKVKANLVAEFLQSFNVALNTMSATYRTSQLISSENEISKSIFADPINAGTWELRFGLKLIKATIEDIELSDSSKELIKRFAERKMDLTALEDVTKKASDISAQQKIAEGIQNNGFGNVGGMLFGMNMAQGLNMVGGTNSNSVDQQLETLKKLKDALDSGILTQEEFETKKKEVLEI